MTLSIATHRERKDKKIVIKYFSQKDFDFNLSKMKISKKEHLAADELGRKENKFKWHDLDSPQIKISTDHSFGDHCQEGCMSKVLLSVRTRAACLLHCSLFACVTPNG